MTVAQFWALALPDWTINGGGGGRGGGGGGGRGGGGRGGGGNSGGGGSSGGGGGGRGGGGGGGGTGGGGGNSGGGGGGWSGGNWGGGGNNGGGFDGTWGEEILIADFGETPAATVTRIDISAYDVVHLVGMDLDANVGGILYRLVRSGTPVSTAGYYHHLRQQELGKDLLTHDAEGTLTGDAGAPTDGYFNWEIEHHNNSSIPTMATCSCSPISAASEVHTMMTDVAETHDAMDIYTADTNNVTRGKIYVIGYNYPTYEETLIDSFDFSVSGANQIICDTLQTYDEVKIFGWAITSPNTYIWMRLRNSETDISSSEYYVRVGTANSDYTDPAEQGFCTVNTPTLGAFTQRIRWHKSTTRPTEMVGHMHNGGVSGALESCFVKASAESHEGIRLFTHLADPFTSGKVYVVGINRGEVATVLEQHDFAATAAGEVITDLAADYHEITYAGWNLTSANQIHGFFRIDEVDQDGVEYYRRNYVGGSTGHDEQPNIYPQGSAGGTEQMTMGRMRLHLSDAWPTMLDSIRGDTTAICSYFQNYPTVHTEVHIVVPHTGLRIADSAAGDWTAGDFVMHGIQYL